MGSLSSRPSPCFRKKELARSQEVEPHTHIHLSNPAKCLVQTFTDEIIGSKSYGRTWFIYGFLLPIGNGLDDQIFHLIFWYSSKQAKIPFSSVGAEILTSSDDADWSLHECDGLVHIFVNKTSFTIRLTVDSFRLYFNITPVQEGSDYRLRLKVTRLHDSFESKEISIFHFIAGNHNIADALTKTNVHFFTLLNEIKSSQIRNPICLSDDR